MSEIDYALFEAPVGYAVFKVVHQADVVSLKTKEGQETANDLSKFGKMIKIVNFSPFRCVMAYENPPSVVSGGKRG
jgi:nucleolar protein 56